MYTRSVMFSSLTVVLIFVSMSLKGAAQTTDKEYLEGLEDYLDFLGKIFFLPNVFG